MFDLIPIIWQFALWLGLVISVSTNHTTAMLCLQQSTRLTHRCHNVGMSVLSIMPTILNAAARHRYISKATATFSTRSRGLRNVIWARLGTTELHRPLDESIMAPVGYVISYIGFSDHARESRKFIFRRSSIPILLPTQEVAQAAQASFNESNPFNDSKAITCIIHNARIAAFHIRKSEIALAADYHLKAADVVHAELNKIVKSTGRTVSRSRIDCSLHVH
jgi:hypothetical protein